MSDFVTALREELVDAAERERTRRLPRVHAPAPRLVLAVAATAAMALIVLLAAGALNTRTADDERQAAHADARGARPVRRHAAAGRALPHARLRPRALVRGGRTGDWQVGDTTQPDVLILDHGEGFFDPDGERRPPGGLWFTRVLQVYDPAVRGLAASVAPAPADLYAWMRAHPDLRVGPPRPVTVAGVPGDRFDVEVRFRRPTHDDPALPRALPGDVHGAARRGWRSRTARCCSVTVLRTGARAAGDHARALHEGGPPRSGEGGRPRARLAADRLSHSTVSVPSMPLCAVLADRAVEGVLARLEVDGQLGLAARDRLALLLDAVALDLDGVRHVGLVDELDRDAARPARTARRAPTRWRRPGRRSA